ncbi:MAG: putative Ig domain-containing protein [Acidobacteriia bacterium]|nr:putative Ig domain-containing protein [Terriglobia bacterium]
MYVRNVILAALVLAGAALAQTPMTTDPPFQVRHAANLTVGESYVYITNDGANGASVLGPGLGSAGNICVNVYAMAPDEQLVSCCSCLVTPNGLVTLGVNHDILSNTLTRAGLGSAVIKLVSTLASGNGAGTSCANSAALVGQAHQVSGMLAWGTTLNILPSGGVTMTETPFSPATLSQGELASLGGRCASIMGNGSGFGICGPCQSNVGCTLAVACPDLTRLPVQIPIRGGTPPYTCSATGLPSGTFLSGCTIMGTPPTGAFNINIRVTDSSSPSCSASTNCSFTPPLPTTLGATCQNFCAVQGIPITPVSASATGGNPPYTFSQSGLPHTLGIAPATGIIAGTVTDSPGSYPYTVTVTDTSVPQQIATSLACTVTVAPALTATCPVLTSRRGPPSTNVPINPALVPISGGTPPYTCSATGLAPGLTMSPACVISGTITTPIAQCEANPNFTYTISVRDSGGLCPAAAQIDCPVKMICDP